MASQTGHQLLDLLVQRGASFRLQGDRVAFTPPPGGCTEEELSALRESREEIRELVERSGGPLLPLGFTSIPRAEGEEAPPLTIAQEGIWYLSRVTRGATPHVTTGGFRLSGKLDVPALERALTSFVRRHDALGFGFREEGGRPRSLFEVPQAVDLEIRDFSTFPEMERDPSAIGWMEDQAREPFDISEPPLIRFFLGRLSEEEHVLLLVAHEMAWDGWCYDIFLKELGVLYASESGRGDGGLPDPAIRFRDYAHWHRSTEAEARRALHLEHWRRKLGDEVPDLGLPTDFPRPPVLTYGADRVYFRLEDADSLKRIRALAREEHTSTFTVLLTVYALVLSRYAGQREIIIGTPAQGRFLPELEDLVGFFVNPIPVGISIEPGISFRDLLRQVRDECLEALDHQEVPIEVLRQDIGRRDPSRTGIFQTQFTLQDTRARTTRWGNLEVRSVPRGSHATYTDLNAWAREYENYLDAGLDFRTDLFRRERIQGMTDAFLELLKGAVRDPDQRADALPVLSDARRREIVESRAGPHRPEFLTGSILDWMAESAARYPDKTAVMDETSAMTFQEFRRTSDGVARRLQEAGREDGGLVGILVERTLGAPAILAGILKSGKAYLPLDPDFPGERLKFMMEDSGVRRVIVSGSLRDRLPEGVEGIVAEELLKTAWEVGAHGHPPQASPGPQELAYVIYTSGSTGRPKGVEITHGSLKNFLGSMREVPGLDPTDVFYALTTLSFDISVLEIFLPLCTGATLCLDREGAFNDGATLDRRLGERGATVVQATPTSWKALVDSGWNGPLRMALSGGEPLGESLARALQDRAERVWNLYGPTETTVWSAIHDLSGEWSIPPIGQPIANTRAYVLDEKQRPVPDGVTGEIWLAGDGLARGYLGRPELTAERFQPDVVMGDAGDRMYRTGDLGYWDLDGRLMHQGRQDHQVKVRGFRVELGEIEAAVLECDAVKDVVVSALGQGTEKRLVAYVILHEPGSVMGSELRREMSQRLPRYLVPGAFVEMDAFPLTPNGKIDRKGLPDPYAAAPQTEVDHVPPDGEAEEALAAVWRDLLGVEEVGRDDNFFDLGGHSLQSLEAVAEYHRRTGRRLDPRAFFFMSLHQVAASAEPEAA